MRDDLIERALLHNPHLAKSLQHARQGGKMTDVALRIWRNAAEIPPLLQDQINLLRCG
ncbi:MAG: hypothetical protein K0R08_655 [Solimicrobium sp.]|nr:hypothetical protein [Solimicrobium sp.]